MTSWDTGRPQIPRWLLLGAAVVTVVALGATARSAIGTSSELPVHSASEDVAPTPIRDALEPCERSAPVAAIGDNAYPPGFPAVPDAPLEACYETVDAAIADGYVVPDTPSTVDVVGGVYLVKLTAEELRACLARTRTAGFGLPCLGWRPSGGVESQCIGSCGTRGGYVRFFRNIPVPADWCDDCMPQLVVAAVPVDGPARARSLVSCPHRGGGNHPPQEKTFFCDASQVSSTAEPHAGHTMRIGRQGGTVFAVSTAGRGDRQAALVDRIFETLLFVR